LTLRLVIAAATALMLFTSASPARADVVLTPFVGSLFSGDLPDSKVTYGVSAAFTGAGIIGFEVDLGFAPDFVPETSVTAAVKALSLMGNIIVGIPIGGTTGVGVRPYVSGGVGLFRATAEESDFLDRINSNDFAFNVGGGVMGFFADNIGIRGDLRYFRTLSDEEAGSGIDVTLGELNFLRATVGAAFRF
jgi:opacity protein-like surface antigen